MNLKQIINDCASVYLEDYKSWLVKLLLPEICNIIHGFYFDEMEFEEQVLHRAGDAAFKIDNMTDLRAFFNNGHIVNAYARKWFKEAYTICEAYWSCHFWLHSPPGQGTAIVVLTRMFLPELHRGYFVDACIRPCCFWRLPHQCICSKPVMMVQRHLIDHVAMDWVELYLN